MKFYLALSSLCLFLGLPIEGKKTPLHEFYNCPVKMRPSLLNLSDCIDLKTLLGHLNPATLTAHNIVDIGAFNGARSCFLAKHIRNIEKIYSADTWCTDFSRSYEPGFDLAFDQFVTNVQRSGFTSKIQPVHGKSEEVILDPIFQSLPTGLSLVFLDLAAIYTNITKNIEDWFELVEGSGVLCGNGWNFHKAQQEISAFAQNEGLQVITSGDYWLLKEE